jgi:predicted phosphate transport protein (TIGR00153 family)
MVTVWAWLARRRQMDVIEHCTKHLDAVLQVVRSAQKAVEAYSQGDRALAEQAYHDLFNAERRADEIKRSIFSELVRAVIHPIDREELIRLVIAADDIADYTKSSIRRLLYLDPRQAPKELLSTLNQVAAKLVKAVELAIEAVRALVEDRSRVLELTNRIERIEEEVDEIRTEAEGRILSRCNEYGITVCILALHVLEGLETATDKAEDLGDVIRSIALLS